jgi:hypothetical protein
MQQTRNTFIGLIPSKSWKKATNNLLSDFRPKFCKDSLVPILPCTYIHKLNLTKPYEENKYAFSHWTNNILHPHPSIFSPLAQQSLGGESLLTIEASRSHSDTPQSVRLPWTSDHPTAETSTKQHTTFTRDRHPCPRRDSNPQFQQSSGRRSTPSLDLRFGIFLGTSFHTP